MKTIQMTLDDELVENVDKVVKRLHTNRSAFTREALQDALNKYNALQLEQQHYQGYRRSGTRTVRVPDLCPISVRSPSISITDLE